MFRVRLGPSASQVKVPDELTHPGVGTPFLPPPHLQPPPPSASTAEVLQSLEGERFRSTALAFLKLQCPNSPSNPSCPRHQLTYPGPLQRVGCKETRPWRGSLEQSCRWGSDAQTLARVKREETVPRASAVKPGCWDCSGHCNGVFFFFFFKS